MEPLVEDCENNNIDIPKSNPFVPMRLGLEFNSDDEAYNYYNYYAKAVGFSIRKEYVNTNKVHGYVTSRKLTCYKEGYRVDDKRSHFVKKPRRETRMGCLAHIVFSRQSNGKYYVTSFEEKHNHPLASPATAHLLPSHRKIQEAQAYEIDLTEDSGICPKYAFELAARRAGGRANLGYTKRDQNNYIRDKRKSYLKPGEAGSLLEYFERRRLEDPGFQFSLDLDDDGMITNMFWADTKMIMDYRTFGEVVSFDTTYRTNKNYRPLALFVGMNNHREMVIFGASLLYNEETESFVWLFNAFLRVMSSEKPKTFISDQAPAIMKAVPLVMPETYHRLCTWHLEKNAFKNLNHIYRGQNSFSKDFGKLIYEYVDDKEFTDEWNIMLEKYDLKENHWLKETFKVREKWLMAYGRNTFFAGMRSTQLSESFNGSLRDYLKSDLDLVQFFKHFQRAVDEKRYNELDSNHDMSQKFSVLKVNLPLLKHARDVYTSTIFEMLQEQCEKSLLVVVHACNQDGQVFEYKVTTQNGRRVHTVIANPLEVTVSCSCKLFEYLGILCRHALKVLDLMNVKTEIPSKYILRRWTKEATIIYEMDTKKCNQEDDPVLEVTRRYRNLCSTFIGISNEAACSIASYELAMKCASELALKLKDINKAEQIDETLLNGSANAINFGGGDLVVDGENLKKVNGLKKKQPTYRGRPRLKSFMEKTKRKKRTGP